MPVVSCAALLLCGVILDVSVRSALSTVPDVAHPAFSVLASYAVFFLNVALWDRFRCWRGCDHYRYLSVVSSAYPGLYYETFEKRGQRLRRAAGNLFLLRRLGSSSKS